MGREEKKGSAGTRASSASSAADSKPDRERRPPKYSYKNLWRPIRFIHITLLLITCVWSFIVGLNRIRGARHERYLFRLTMHEKKDFLCVLFGGSQIASAFLVLVGVLAGPTSAVFNATHLGGLVCLCGLAGTLASIIFLQHPFEIFVSTAPSVMGMATLVLVTLLLSLSLMLLVRRRRRSKYWNKFAAVAVGFLDAAVTQAAAPAAAAADGSNSQKKGGGGSAGADAGGEDDDGEHDAALDSSSSALRRRGAAAAAASTKTSSGNGSGGSSSSEADSGAVASRQAARAMDAGEDDDDDEDDSDAERELDAKAARLTADIAEMATKFAEFKRKHGEELLAAAASSTEGERARGR